MGCIRSPGIHHRLGMAGWVAATDSEILRVLGLVAAIPFDFCCVFFSDGVFSLVFV